MRCCCFCLCRSNRQQQRQQQEVNSRPKWLILTLLFSLSFTILRQAFDLIGKLWFPVVINLLQIFSCLTGLFAILQTHRQILLFVFNCSCLLFFFYNIFLILWYSDFIINGHQQSSLLSVGLPFSHSFFIRYTPFCQARFDLDVLQWKQDEGCFIPYTYLERAQALLHALFALVCIILGTSAFIDRRYQQAQALKCQRSSIYAGPSMANLTTHKLYGSNVTLNTNSGRRAKVQEAHPRSLEKDSCINVHNDGGSACNLEKVTFNGSAEKFKKVAQNVRNKNSSARYFKNSTHNRSGFEEVQNFKQNPLMEETMKNLGEDYSSMSTVEAETLSGRRLGTARVFGHETGGSSSSSPYSKPSFQHHPKLDASFRSIIQQHLSDQNNHSEIQQASENASTYDDYIHPKTDWGIENSMYSTKATSLVTFDPKSNTLIRVREHHNSFDEDPVREIPQTPVLQSFQHTEDERHTLQENGRSDSQNSLPSFVAPIFRHNRTLDCDAPLHDYDSTGKPKNYGKWTSSGSSTSSVFQNSNFSAQNPHSSFDYTVGNNNFEKSTFNAASDRPLQPSSTDAVFEDHSDNTENWPIEADGQTIFPGPKIQLPRRPSIVGFSASSLMHLSGPDDDFKSADCSYKGRLNETRIVKLANEQAAYVDR